MAIEEKSNRDLHRIVVVGGGAGGLELATQLGRTLGRRKRAHPAADLADELQAALARLRTLALSSVMVTLTVITGPLGR